MAIKSNRAEISRKLRDTVDERLEKSGVVVSNAAKEEIVRLKVIDTGRTLSSVTYQKEGDTVRVGTPVRYAVYPHQGTRFVEPRPWLVLGTNKARPALVALWSRPLE